MSAFCADPVTDQSYNLPSGHAGRDTDPYLLISPQINASARFCWYHHKLTTVRDRFMYDETSVACRRTSVSSTVLVPDRRQALWQAARHASIPRAQPRRAADRPNRSKSHHFRNWSGWISI